MTRKIFCPTDGTNHFNQAIIHAAELAAKFDAALTVCVVNVVEGPLRGAPISHWTDAEAQKIVADAATLAKKSGTSADTAVIISREAAAGIVTYAEEHGFDHIVMGTGDKRGVSRLMLGSVAADVAARAHCAVTVAR